jgi:predicted methyltransferase
MTNILKKNSESSLKKGITLLLLAAISTFAVFMGTYWSNERQEQITPPIPIESSASLIHVGSNDSFATTQDGILAGRFVLDYLENKQPDAAQKAIKLYDRLIPVENYGGEYSALQWFCQYLLASPQQQETFLANKFVANFYNFFAEDDFARLKEYLQRKYKLKEFADTDTEAGEHRLAVLEDTILFNNPRREEWEKSSKFMNILQLKPGQTVADIGSGPGYYTYQFSQLVGDNGKVYAIDTVKDHLDYINNFSQENNLENIETVHTSGETIGRQPKEVDLAFMCSLYHNIYALSKDNDRDSFVNSIKNALKPNGTLVVVDNALVVDNQLPYHGPYIAKELIIGQLKYYGFHLVKDYGFVPQRYILYFQKD